MELFSVNIPEQLPLISVTDEDCIGFANCQSKDIAYGSYVFPAAISLSEYLIDNLELFYGKKVLELGSGFGLAGLVCARNGSSKVVLSDGLQKVVDNIKETIKNNNLDKIVSTRVLKWHELDQTMDEKFDVIIGTDITYSPDSVHIPSLLSKYLAPNGKCILIHEVRQAEEHDHIIRDLKSNCSLYNFTVEETVSSFKNKEILPKLFININDFYSNDKLENMDKIILKRIVIS